MGFATLGTPGKIQPEILKFASKVLDN